MTKYAIGDNGKTVSFDSKVTYSRAVFGGQAYKGDVKVKISIKDDILNLEIGGMKVQEKPGITVTRPPEEHRYKKQKEADYLILKSGEKITGKILNDSFTIKQFSEELEHPGPGDQKSFEQILESATGMKVTPRGDARIIEYGRKVTRTLKYSDWQVRSIVFDAIGPVGLAILAVF
ncbi:hypothetical protein ES703_105630 [subsurface metagenome]